MFTKDDNKCLKSINKTSGSNRCSIVSQVVKNIEKEFPLLELSKTNSVVVKCINSRWIIDSKVISWN